MSIKSNFFSCSNLNFYFCLLVLLMTEYGILKSSAMIMDLIFMGNGVNLCISRLY